jgi:hypothetical protein
MLRISSLLQFLLFGQRTSLVFGGLDGHGHVQMGNVVVGRRHVQTAACGNRRSGQIGFLKLSSGLQSLKFKYYFLGVVLILSCFNNRP